MRNECVPRPVFLLILVASLHAGIALASVAPEEPDEPVVETPSAEVPLKIPAAERNRKNPVPPSTDSVRHGEELFTTQCVMCHGIRGDGKGDLVARLGLHPPDFTDPKPETVRTDGEFFYILTHGHGDMPGEGERLPDEWKWDLVNYIRALARHE